MAEILTESESDIALAGALLRAGEIVAVPTETVYGLAANAFCERAVRAIFAAKNRPFIDPLIVHVLSPEQAGTLADLSHPFAQKLARAFWPGPLTLILPKKNCVPAVVTAGAPTVAVRAPAHPLMRRILAAAGVPLAAPSANPFGYVSPTTAAHVQESLGGKIAKIVDGGACSCGVESTIVRVADAPQILRPGVISREQIERVLGVPVAFSKGILEQKSAAAGTAESAGTAENCAPQLAPGMLKRHYSPRVRVTLFENGAFPPAFLCGEGANSGAARGNAAFVFQSRASEDAARAAARVPAGAAYFRLSERGAQEDVARNVFALLRRLDGGDFSEIFIEKSPERGIGVAVNDRLSRAAAR